MSPFARIAILVMVLGALAPLRAMGDDASATGAANPAGALILTLRHPDADSLAVPTTAQSVSLMLHATAAPGDRIIELRARRNGHPVFCLPLDDDTLDREAPIELIVGHNQIGVEVVSALGRVSRVELDVLRNTPTAGSPTMPLAGQTVTLRGDWRVAEELLVPADATLVLAAGCVLRFAAGVGLECRGTLRTEGTAAQRVWLLTADARSRWSNVLIAGETAHAAFAHTVWWHAGGRSNEWLDDHTVAGSAARSPVSHAGHGTDGGALMVLGCSNESVPISLAHCRFVDCRAEVGTEADVHGTGGALFVERSALTLSDCSFTHCRAARDGGAVFAFKRSRLQLADCVFTANRAGRDGGAVTLMLNDAADFMRVTFEANAAARNGGAINVNHQANGKLESCRLQGNSAKAGGGMLVTRNQSARISSCDLRDNRATFEGGGAFLASGATATLHACRIRQNQAGTTGGGLTVLDSAPELHDCEICDNRVSSAGSGAAGGLAVRYARAFGGARLQRNDVLGTNEVSGNRPADLVIDSVD